mmetsp:Transcript_45133/g.90127  ORF Transcript_45133/g.90127 Transcript_45133/m.90127 type:complete len:218 (-) Transcript_45133:9-662(-)
MEYLALCCNAADVFTVLAPYERKGFQMVAVKSRGAGAIIVLRASPAACVFGRAMAAALQMMLPAGAMLVSSASTVEAKQWMSEASEGRLELWDLEDEAVSAVVTHELEGRSAKSAAGSSAVVLNNAAAGDADHPDILKFEKEVTSAERFEFLNVNKRKCLEAMHMADDVGVFEHKYYVLHHVPLYTCEQAELWANINAWVSHWVRELHRVVLVVVLR